MIKHPTHIKFFVSVLAVCHNRFFDFFLLSNISSALSQFVRLVPNIFPLRHEKTKDQETIQYLFCILILSHKTNKMEKPLVIHKASFVVVVFLFIFSIN